MTVGFKDGTNAGMLRCPVDCIAHLTLLPAHTQGASANWWNHRHFQHHAKPNIFHKDPDVKMLHVFVLGEWQPVEVQPREGRRQGGVGSVRYGPI